MICCFESPGLMGHPNIEANTCAPHFTVKWFSSLVNWVYKLLCLNIVNCSFIIHITFIVRISYSLETDWCNVWDCFDFSFSIYIHYSDPDYALFWNWDYHNILEHNVLGERLPTFQLFCIVMISRLCSVQCSIVHLF